MSFALLGLRLLLTSTAFNQKRGVGFDGYGSIRTYLIFFSVIVPHTWVLSLFLIMSGMKRVSQMEDGSEDGAREGAGMRWILHGESMLE